MGKKKWLLAKKVVRDKSVLLNKYILAPKLKYLCLSLQIKPVF